MHGRLTQELPLSAASGSATSDRSGGVAVPAAPSLNWSPDTNAAELGSPSLLAAAPAPSPPRGAKAVSCREAGCPGDERQYQAAAAPAAAVAAAATNREASCCVVAEGLYCGCCRSAMAAAAAVQHSRCHIAVRLVFLYQRREEACSDRRQRQPHL